MKSAINPEPANTNGCNGLQCQGKNLEATGFCLFVLTRKYLMVADERRNLLTPIMQRVTCTEGEKFQVK
ncbi:MAG TPA: hypothetical protein ENN79_15395 [Desulfobacteraceae bacterium]|nr:hypothetical protein [Desulfobacteraceae bacterium]